MIRGINPYTISYIKWSSAGRLGDHPRWNRYMKKKNPIRGFLGMYDSLLFDVFYQAEVGIFGADGKVLMRIQCRSNDRAKELCAEMNKELAEWVEKRKY